MSYGRCGGFRVSLELAAGRSLWCSLPMLEWFTETSGRQRLVFGLVGIGINVGILFIAHLIWFWLWAVAIVLVLSAFVGEW
jgi:hypothetical protein